MVALLATQPADPLVGTLLAEKYEIEAELGRGGMGVVYRATHVGLAHKVAIKILRHDLSTDAETAERFAREARIVARLDSAHIVRVFDAGNHRQVGSYIVMEYLEGENLYDRIQRTGPLGLGQAASYVLQAISGIEQAHDKGIVHRDLKPENLFLARTAHGSEVLKVLDFGVSKLNEPTPSSLTRSQVLLGSPRYMAPEQIMSMPDVDERADVWALGVVLYELTTGEAPFSATSLAELCAQVVNDVPVPPSRFRPELPAAFDDLVLGCLQKDPGARTESVTRLAQALRSCLLTQENSQGQTKGSQVRARPPAPLEPDTAMNLAATLGEDPSRMRPVWRRLGPLALLAALAGFFLTALLCWPGGSESMPSAPPVSPREAAATPAAKPASKPRVPRVKPDAPPVADESARTPPALGRRVLSARALAMPPRAHRPPPKHPTPRAETAQPRSKRDSLPNFGGRR